MPWTASSVMEERLRFVARLLDGEAMTDVCRDFGVSRKTGYKIFDRYKEHGLSALSDRSRRPVRYANQLPQQVESLIVRLKAEKPHWGARKILASSWSGGSAAMSEYRLRAPSMRFSIATAMGSGALSIGRYFTEMLDQSTASGRYAVKTAPVPPTSLSGRVCASLM